MFPKKFEVFLQTATCLEVTTFVRVEEGFTLVLTGSTQSTGEWNLHYAKPATEFPKRSGYWKVHVAFDALTNLEFKWAIVKEKDQGVLRIQEKLPHSIFGRKSWMRAVAPWMTPLIVVVDTSLLCDLTDTKQGRTDLIVKSRKQTGEEIKSWLVKSEGDKSAPSSAKPAHKSSPSPFEKPTSMALLNIQAQTPVRVSSSIPPTPTFSNIVLSTHRTPELDEIRLKEEMSRTERMTQILYKKYSEETAINVIKGKGQKQAPTDKMNIGDPQVEATEVLSSAYGEVAEITSMHVPACSAISKQKPKHPLLDRQEVQDNVQLARKHNEKSLTRILKSEETPLALEGECVQIKGAVYSDNDSNEDECPVPGVPNEVMPLYVKSQTVAEAVPSDTGFTEMSSWISSAKTDATASESALTSSHTTTCVLAADANNVSDGEDSHSEHVAFRSNRLDSTNDGMLSYWESQQQDLTPPWLDKAHGHFQGGCGDLADSQDAFEEDYEHLEWLASRLEEEEADDYGTKNFESDYKVKSDYLPADDIFFIREGKIESALDSSFDPTKWSPSSPPKSSSVDGSPLKFTRLSEAKQNLLNNSNEIGASYSGDFDPLYDNDLTPYSIINSDSDDEEITERRRIARALEKRWGTSYSGLEGPPVETLLKSKQSFWTDLDHDGSVFGALAEGIPGFTLSEGTEYKMAYYSLNEHSDTLFPDTDFVCHREKARELERMWGQSQGGKSWMSNETGTHVRNEELIRERVS